MAETVEVIWAQAAVRDLDDLLDYLAAEAGVDRALALYEAIRRRIADLSEMPRRCRHVPELQAIGLTEFREAILSPDRVFFRLVEHRGSPARSARQPPGPRGAPAPARPRRLGL